LEKTMQQRLWNPKTLSTLLLSLFASLSVQAVVQQGINKTEIVVGTIQDLSGPLAGYGK
jgi:branched-chain amino acid transport system substrate-binding protein